MTPTTERPAAATVARPAATLLALDATWRTVSDPARRRRRLIQSLMLIRSGNWCCILQLGMARYCVGWAASR